MALLRIPNKNGNHIKFFSMLVVIVVNSGMAYVNLKKLKILHLLSQRPDSTGSGIYGQAMIREATACGEDNYKVASKCAQID